MSRFSEENGFATRDLGGIRCENTNVLTQNITKKTNKQTKMTKLSFLTWIVKITGNVCLILYKIFHRPSQYPTMYVLVRVCLAKTLLKSGITRFYSKTLSSYLIGLCRLWRTWVEFQPQVMCLILSGILHRPTRFSVMKVLVIACLTKTPFKSRITREEGKKMNGPSPQALIFAPILKSSMFDFLSS